MSLFFIFQIALICVLVYLLFAFIFFICFCHFVKPKNNNLVFCDIFSGTGVVGKYFKKKGYSVISNDIQYYSYVTAKHFIENNVQITFSRNKGWLIR